LAALGDGSLWVSSHRQRIRRVTPTDHRSRCRFTPPSISVRESSRGLALRWCCVIPPPARFSACWTYQD